MVIENLVEYIVSKYKCHTIILYGSYAKNTYDKESDIDIIGFTNLDIEIQDKSAFEDVELDLWIYNEAKLKNAEDYLHIRSGVILLDNNDVACNFLLEINELFNKGPEPLSITAKQNSVIWLEKMLKRTLKGDLEGRFREIWLLSEMLPIYFELNDRYYLGSKESFEWLKSNDIEAYKLFEQMYYEPNGINISKLIEHMKIKTMQNVV